MKFFLKMSSKSDSNFDLKNDSKSEKMLELEICSNVNKGGGDLNQPVAEELTLHQEQKEINKKSKDQLEAIVKFMIGK